MRRLVAATLIVALLATPAFAINDKLLHGAAGFAIQAVFEDPNEGFIAATAGGGERVLGFGI